ncbi:MAG: hypothetical protein JWP87_856 [Labilithrix sp.]|nr:hypothetical protein [Labilithrix sp.]
MPPTTAIEQGAYGNRQYAGGGSPASAVSTGFGQDDVFEPQHVFVLVSQHCTPPARAGQLLVQSESVAQDGAHFFSGAEVGAVLGVDAGSLVSGVGSVGSAAVSSGGTSALLAQAASAPRRAVTTNADFDKVAYFTAGTLCHGFRKFSPDRLTESFRMSDRESRDASTPEIKAKDASYIGSTPRTETRKKSRRPLLELTILLAVGALLFSPAVLTPLFLDDHLQGAMVEGTFPAPRNAFNLYDFVDDADRTALTDRGLLPWWSHPKLTIRFFRPLSSALLWVDHRVFSHAPLPMHLHSLVWWVAAVLAVRSLYRKIFSARIALMATAIFALAPCHALPIAWVANRETLVCLVFGALALAAQARWRDGRSLRDGALAGAFFALALLGGGEYALCFGGYVLAMDVVRRESVPRRIGGWAPFLVPALAYLAVRGVLGYGTAGSGFYSDPIRDPGEFLAGAPWHAVALLATGWLTLDAEAWRLGLARWLLAAIVVAVAAGLVVPVRRALAALPAPSRNAAVWLLVGSALALVPTLAVVPARRLLGVSMVGVAVVVAIVIERAWFPGKGEATVSRGRAASLASLAALGLGFTHLVHGPGTAWLEARKHRLDASDFATRVAWLRQRVGVPTTKAEIGIMRGMAGVFFAPFALDARGRPPRRWCVLAQAGHVLALRRDALTVDLVATEGRTLYPIGERNLYRSEAAQLRAGDQLAVRGLRVTILEVGEAGPRSARFVFDTDPGRLVWISDMFDETKEVELPHEGFGEPFDP